MPISAKLTNEKQLKFNTLDEAIANLGNIQELNIGYNNIGDSGVEKLSKALENNTTLKSLNLRMNKIENPGAEHIARALEYNTTLTSLNLEGNKIGDEGAKHIASILEKNTTLKSLDLCANKIGNEGTQFIAGRLNKNYRIRHLNLTYNNTDATALQKINSILTEHRKQVASSIIELYYSGGKKIYAAKILELAFNYYGEGLLEDVMACLGEETPDNARDILNEVRKMYPYSGVSKTNDIGQYFPKEILGEIASHALPPYQDSFRAKEEADKKASSIRQNGFVR